MYKREAKAPAVTMAKPAREAQTRTAVRVDRPVSARLQTSPQAAGFASGNAAALLTAQRTFGNRHVQRMVQPPVPAGRTGAHQFGAIAHLAPASVVLVQRDTPGGAAAPAPVPVPAEAPTTTDAPAAGGAQAPAPVAQKKAVDLTLTAIYEDVPGKAADTIKRAKDNESVWLDPLDIFSNYPLEKRSKESYGVVAGGGQKTVDTFRAPISDSDPVNGRGSITASLKYASDKQKSFDVKVSGIKKKDEKEATALARASIERELRTFGDVDEIISTVEGELNAQEKFKGSKVAVKVNDKKVMDAGRTTFHYKVRSDASILMDLQVTPVGEKQTKVSGSKTEGTATEDEAGSKVKTADEKEDISKKEKDTYKKKDTSIEEQDVEYNESVVRTIDDYISKTTTVHNQLASNLSEEIIKHSEAKWGEKTTSARSYDNYQDYTKDSKHTVESGKRDKENWAAKLRKGVGFAKKITTIPYVDKIPVLGWLTRRVKGWQLDLIDAGLGIFEEKGTVDFTDTKLDETIKSKGGGKDNTTTTKDVELKQDDKTEVKRKLIEDFKSKTQEDWKRHMDDVTETRKTYHSKIRKDAETDIKKEHTEDYKKEGKKVETEEEKRTKVLKNQSTTTNFEVATTWKFTKPIVNATVTSGDAEVSHSPLPPEPGELAAKAKTP